MVETKDGINHVYNVCVFVGQEDGTVDFDGEIQITPFNMKEELEEGHFDKQGMYIYDKKQVMLVDYDLVD